MPNTNQQNAKQSSEHTFFIPVMGTGFTLDTPLKVARYGIDSVLSLVDDCIIEQLRKYHCERQGEPYQEITAKDEDHRARRITAYLDLLDRLVARDTAALRSAPFAEGSEISKYFRLLPECSLKRDYQTMLSEKDTAKKSAMQEALRARVVPGSIDVNIMTKLDREYFRDGKPLPPETSDAMSALRGYARSTLRSSIVFSAGLNQRLYTYIAQFGDFFPDAVGKIKKQIVLKVSDFRSAAVQGKFLAKRGLWVSEYHIESGINCGGHAFTGKGHLMGPVLEEFLVRRDELFGQLHEVYLKALPQHVVFRPSSPMEVRITAAGGIGTAEEHEFLRSRYRVEKVGWGTPFLLVPEVVNIDDVHLQKLAAATEKDVFLSIASPLGVPFWNLRNSASEQKRRLRIAEGKPGSPCTKGYCRVHSPGPGMDPVCHSARSYVAKRLREKDIAEMPELKRRWTRLKILAKSCICHDLSGALSIRNGLNSDVFPAVCCGPNIVNFSRVAGLQEMVDHIYGRISLLARPERPNVFLKELSLYSEQLKAEIDEFCKGLADQAPANLADLRENLARGIEYYKKTAEEIGGAQKERFLAELRVQKEKIEGLFLSLSEEPVPQGT